MGKADIVTKAYMRKSNIFADAFNYLIYDGKKVVDPEKLTEVDSTEIAIPFGATEERKEAKETTEMTEDPVQKYRDILKTAVIMQEAETYYLLLGIENQTDIHYAMPVRNMIYDALQYGRQVTDTAARHRKNRKSAKQQEKDHGDDYTKAEYLSGFYKDDVLKPVITLVIHFGTDPWDAPLSLHEMMNIQYENLLRFVQDYRIHLIDPARLTEEDLEKFSSSLREVMEYIKYSKDKKKLLEILKDNPRMMLDRKAAVVIKTITNTPIEIPEEMEVIDVCKAVEDMLKESREQGIEKKRWQHSLRGVKSQKYYDSIEECRGCLRKVSSIFLCLPPKILISNVTFLKKVMFR